MVYLAKHLGERFSVRSLPIALDMHDKYLGRLMNKLAEAGLLDVEQGNRGGYRILINLDSIYLYQIADLIEGLDDYERCILGFQECPDDCPGSLPYL